MDDTGTYGSQGQSGPVWFLAGTFGGDAVERHLTAPAGKALLAPLVNGAFWAPEDGAIEAEVRAAVKGFVDTTDTLAASLDGQPLSELFRYRAQSPTGGFTLGIPASSFLAEVGYAPGDRTPAVSDGYWLMLAPLSVGKHTLHFSAIGDYINVDVSYHLTVQPGS